MAGNIKVGGNTIFTHTGAVGAGTVTLKDQSGNAILTDDGTAVTLNADAAVIEGSSSGDLVRITQTGSGNALVVEDNTNPDATPFVIDDLGNAVFGHTGTVEFSDSLAITPSVQINRAAATTFGISRFSDNGAANGVIFLKSRGTTIGDFSIVQNNDPIGFLYFIGADGNDGIRAAAIAAYVDGTPGTNDMPGRLIFQTTPDGSTDPAERMRIDSDGNVSITSGYVTLNNNKIGGIQVSVADDAYAEITPPRRGAHIISIVEDGDNTFPDTNVYYMGYLDFGSSVVIDTIKIGLSVDTNSGGPPTGTTGSDARVTLFAGGTPGKIYIENRRGSTATYQITFL